MKKIKTLLATMMLSIGMAQAADELSYTSNKAGGNIIFTYTPCVYVSSGQRVKDQFYVYSTDSGGNKSVDGCFYYKYPFYFVEWNSGGKLTVNVNTVTSLIKQ